MFGPRSGGIYSTKNQTGSQRLEEQTQKVHFPQNAPGSEPDGSYGRKQKLRMKKHPRDFKMVYEVTPNHVL